MRIIAGRWRGRPLLAPPGSATRPTADRVREALFSMLTSRLGSFEGLQVADLFAGSGALGLEALSRGAAHCTFVEKDRQALEILRRNIDRLGAGERADVRAQAVEHVSPGPCDLILMDPPYGQGLAQPALDRLHRLGWIGAGTWIALETAHDEKVQVKALEIETERKVGKAKLNLLRVAASA